MTIDDRPAAATIYFQGLAITCFNESAEQCEMAFVRHPAHHFRVEVFKKRDGVLEDTPFIERNKLPLKSEIKIWGERPALNGIRKYEPGATFDRKSGNNDEHDLRWVVDMEAELHETQLEPTRAAASLGTPLTRAFIRNAEFYTKSRLGELLLLEQSGRRMDADPEFFGAVGDEMGAKLEAETVFLKVNEEEFPLPKERDFEYEIRIGNTRHDHSPHHSEEPAELGNSDFPLYYNVLRDPSGKQFDFTAKSVLLIPSQICNKARCSITKSIKDFA